MFLVINFHSCLANYLGESKRNNQSLQ